MSLPTLRSDLFCSVFSHGRKLKVNILPTYEDIILCYLHASRSKKKQYQNLATDTCQKISDDVLKIWKTVSIPTIQPRFVIRKVKEYYEKYRSLLKPYKSLQNVESYKNRISVFKNEEKALFDIAACQCKDINLCKCDKPMKFPNLEKPFLIDQRTKRKMMIGRIDV